MSTAPLISEETTQSISTLDLRDDLADPATTIVDVRPLAAYNGWRSSGEARGGHIPGAVAFPSAWPESVDDAELKRLLDSKEIEPGREVVLYRARPEDVAAGSDRLPRPRHPGAPP